MQKKSQFAALGFCYFLAFTPILQLPPIMLVNADGQSDDFNIRIQVFLDKYVEKKMEGAPGSAVIMKMSVLKAAKLMTAVTNDFVTKGMMKKCQDFGKHFLFSYYREELTKFRDEFHNQTGSGKEQRMSPLYATGRSELLTDRDNAKTFQLFLSFVIQLGYTVGSKELGLMENDGQLLKRFLKLYVCLEQINARQQINWHKRVSNVYLGAQFDYRKSGKHLLIKFLPEPDITGREYNFNLLKILFGSEERTLVGKMSVANTITLLEFLETKKADEKVDIESVHLDVDNTVNVTKLMKMWSETDHGHYAFYQLKSFGHNLGQRLWDTEQLQQGLFRLFPDAKFKLRKLINKLGSDAQEFHQKMSYVEKEHLQNLPKLHFEEVLPVELGLKGEIRKLVKAKYVVTNWPKELTHMGENSCIGVVSKIYRHQIFDNKLFRLDTDIDQTLAIFSKQVEEYLASQIKGHVEEHWVGKIRKIKYDLEKTEREYERKLESAEPQIRRKVQPLDAEYVDMNASSVMLKKKLKIAERQLEGIRFECMAQKPILLEQAQKIVVALVNLESKARGIFREYYRSTVADGEETEEAAGVAAAINGEMMAEECND